LQNLKTEVEVAYTLEKEYTNLENVFINGCLCKKANEIIQLNITEGV